MTKEYEGILAGTKAIINMNLFDDQSRSYGSKSEGMDLKQFPSGNGSSAQKLVSELMEQIQSNLRDSGEDWERTSKENWREGKINLKISSANDSKEVKLERAIAKMLENAKREDWWNQMPIASGLIGSNKDRRRAIDLVHRYGADSVSYDFVELKIDSDTPLFALMEILLYGLVYLILRKERDWLPECSQKKPVFSAKFVGLRVLAPKRFYDGYELSWLESELTVALSKIIENLHFEDNLYMEISSHWPNLYLLEGWDDSVLTDESALMSILQDQELAFAR